jgi:hypothetical protein
MNEWNVHYRCQINCYPTLLNSACVVVCHVIVGLCTNCDRTKHKPLIDAVNLVDHKSLVCYGYVCKSSRSWTCCVRSEQDCVVVGKILALVNVVPCEQIRWNRCWQVNLNRSLPEKVGLLYRESPVVLHCLPDEVSWLTGKLKHSSLIPSYVLCICAYSVNHIQNSWLESKCPLSGT